MTRKITSFFLQNWKNESVRNPFQNSSFAKKRRHSTYTEFKSTADDGLLQLFVGQFNAALLRHVTEMIQQRPEIEPECSRLQQAPDMIDVMHYVPGSVDEKTSHNGRPASIPLENFQEISRHHAETVIGREILRRTDVRNADSHELVRGTHVVGCLSDPRVDFQHVRLDTAAKWGKWSAILRSDWTLRGHHLREKMKKNPIFEKTSSPSKFPGSFETSFIEKKLKEGLLEASQ
jgi:hypothetical protein